MDQLAEAVKVTLGPKGRNIVIDKQFGNPTITKDGVIDPTKVTRTALQNAASIAGLLLTTECVVVEKNGEGEDARDARRRWHGRDVLSGETL